MRNSIEELETRNIALEQTILSLMKEAERHGKEMEALAIENQRQAVRIEELELGITDGLIDICGIMEKLRGFLKTGGE